MGGAGEQGFSMTACGRAAWMASLIMSDVMASGIGVPFLVRIRVLSCSMEEAGVVGVGLWEGHEAFLEPTLAQVC